MFNISKLNLRSALKLLATFMLAPGFILLSSNLSAQQTPINHPCYKWVDWDALSYRDNGTSVPAGERYTITGRVGNMQVTYSSDAAFTTDTSIFNNYGVTFPTGVPTNMVAIKNMNVSNNTLTFASPVPNPLLVFASVGGASASPVTVRFTQNITTLWNATPPGFNPPTYTATSDGTSITGHEGYFMVEVPGTQLTSINFNYTVAENFANFVFGYNICVCGNGHAEPGEDCDLGALNGQVDSGCTSGCKADDGYVCSNEPINNLATWKNDFDNLIEKYKSCMNTTIPPTNALCLNAASTDVDEIINYHKYITAVNASCTNSGLGGYDKLTLQGKDIYFRCTTDSTIKDYDRQLLSILSSRSYTSTDGAACDTSATMTELFTPNLVLDGSVKSCQKHCDDNKDCVAAVQTTIAGPSASVECRLYSACTAEASGTTTGSTVYIAN